MKKHILPVVVLMVVASSVHADFFFPALTRRISGSPFAGPSSQASVCQIDAEKTRITRGEKTVELKNIYSHEIPDFPTLVALKREASLAPEKSLPAPHGGNLYSYISESVGAGTVRFELKSKKVNKHTIVDSNAAVALVEFMDANCDR